MTELTGQYWHNLDQKNRLSIPAKLREKLGDTFMICMARNGDKCIFAYTLENWELLMEKLNEQVPSKQLTLQQRFISYYSNTVEIDKQGRITIGKNFLDFANITGEVFILGAGRRVEIWAAEEWNSMFDKVSESGDMPSFDLAF